MTYNIYDGAQSTFDEIVAIVLENNPDFLCLNEANGFDTNDNERLHKFAKLTRFPHFFLQKCGDGDEYHVAVLSKFPLKEIQAIHPMSRAAILTTIHSDKGEVTICSTHLSPNSEAERVEESRRILSALADKKQSIIMGDLNSLSERDPYGLSFIDTFNKKQIRKFTDGKQIQYTNMEMLYRAGYIDSAICGNESFENTVPTSIDKDVAHSNMRLDYILLSPSLAQHLKSYTVIKTVKTNYASDHFPILVDL